MDLFLFLEQYNYVSYPFLFLLMFVEGGDGTLLASGFLIKLGYLNPLAVLPVAFISIFIRDFLLYRFGERFGIEFIARFGKFFLLNKNRFEKLKQRISEHPKKTIFISKFLYGLNHITIAIVGATKISFKTFLKINLFSILIWEAFLLILGYSAGQGFNLMKSYVKDVSVFLFIILAAFFAMEFIIRNLIRINNGRAD